jgi:FKBP-type peptidyl-prolyl cis-trans isomerase
MLVRPAVLAGIAFVVSAASCSSTPQATEEKPATSASASASPPPSPQGPSAATEAPTPSVTAIATAPAPSSSSASATASAKRPNGLEVEDLVVGSGPAVVSGTRVSVRYVGTLTDGTIFDQTKAKPFEFEIGKHELIEGWEQGILGMKVGGKRKLTIPPALGYGARGVAPKVPPNTTHR